MIVQLRLDTIEKVQGNSAKRIADLILEEMWQFQKQCSRHLLRYIYSLTDLEILAQPDSTHDTREHLRYVGCGEDILS